MAQNNDEMQQMVHDFSKMLREPMRNSLARQQRKHAATYAASCYGRGVLDPYESAPEQREETGDRIVAAIHAQLDGFGLTRHDHQREFHEMFIKATLPKIYEKTWAQNYDAILRKFSMTRNLSECLIVCPRRFGKTYSVAMFCAAYLMHVPNCEIALFSTGQRTAGKLMALILSFCDMIDGFRDRVQRKTQELLELNFGRGDTRRLNCYPGTVAVRPLRTAPAFSRPCPLALLPTPTSRIPATARRARVSAMV
jgi:hypothetical protein